MTSVFGGSQTVPQLQNTSQNFSQTAQSAQTGQSAQTYAANPYATDIWTGVGAPGARAYSNLIASGDQGVPLLNVAALTPEQQTGIGSIMGEGYNTGNVLIPGATQALNASGQGITAGDINQFLNPYQDYVTQNLQNIFGQQNLANRLGGTAAAGGAGADSAAVGRALLAKQQGLAAGQTYAGLYQQALQAAQQQKAQQLQAGQVGLQAGFGALGQGLQAASMRQAQTQAENQALYQYNLGRYQDQFTRYAALTGAIPTIAGLGGTGLTASSQGATTGQTGTQAGTGQAQTTYPAPPLLGQIAGLGSLALGAGALFSDKRAKTDIQKVGKDKGSGLPMYAYRYKGDPKTYPKVVGPMAQDVKKKYPGAVKEFARGGGIPHFQYGGGQDDTQQQQQDTNYLTGFTDIDTGGSDAPTPPYAEQQSTWDPKRIFSPDRLQKAQRAIAMMQKATQQAQVARPRVSPITFPQVPWKSGPGTFQRGGRLAINLPALNRAIVGQQEGGRVDESTAYDWGPGETETMSRARQLHEGMLRTAAPWQSAKIKNIARPGQPVGSSYQDILRANRSTALPAMREEPGVYAFGGKIKGYALDGAVEGDDDEAEPAGLPELDEDMVTGSPAGLPEQAGAGAIPLPMPRPAAANAGLPFMPSPPTGGGGGDLPQVGAGGQTLFGKPVSPGAMALVQAGLGMLAASGQRDARGLPMSGLGAIGAGGMAGINTYQRSMEDQRKDMLARQGLAMRAQDLALRQQAAANLEKYRTGLLAARTGEDRPITIEGELGKESVVKQPDGTYKRIKVLPAEGEDEETATAFPTNPAEKYDASLASSDAPQTDEQKQVAAFAAASEIKFQTPVAPPVKRLIKHFGISEDEFDFNALRIALGDTSTLTGLTARGGRAGQMLRQAYISRAARYYIEQGLSPHDANAAVAEFAGMKAGARSLANQEAKITGALQSAKAVAPLVTDLSDKIPRTQIKSINTLLMTGKEQIGDKTVVQYKTALETLVADYAQALGRGNTVLTDNARQHARELLEKGYSQGQVKATVDQMLIEIERTQHATQRGMDVYLRRKSGGAGTETGATPPPASGVPMTTVPETKPDVKQSGHTYRWDAAAGKYKAID